MKKVILLFCLIPLNAPGQVVFNFENASLSGWVQSIPGHWTADTVNPVGGMYSLHHVFDNSNAGTDQAGFRLKRFIPSSGTSIWSFSVRHGTDPSSANCWGVFLMSDIDPSEMVPGSPVNGYAIGVNLSGADDTLRLWKLTAGRTEVAGTLPLNWQNDIGTLNAARIIAERTSSGTWNLSVNNLHGTINRSVSFNEPELFSAHWFGVFYRYTSTRDRLLWIDDISVEGVFGDQNLPLLISGADTRGDSSVTARFNYDINAFSLDKSNLSLEPYGYVCDSVASTGANSLLMHFPFPLPDRKPCKLVVRDICDLDSICTGSVSFDFTPAFAHPGDVIITEIMADPLPVVSLPPCEYVELTNISDFDFSLGGWKIISGAETALFPDIKVRGKEIVILCTPGDTSLYKYYGKTIGIKSFPRLSDEGKNLVITDYNGRMIHGLTYTDEWYGDRLKSDGGWSLEMIDTNYPFYYEGNWKASVSPSGGTPGHKNSVNGGNPDIAFRGITNVFPEDSLSVSVTFSEPVKNPELIRGGAEMKGIGIKTINASDLLCASFLIRTSSPLCRKKVYTFVVPSSVTDFAGNKITVNSYRFGLPEEAKSSDIVFNELLFNPMPGDGEFIEMINNSGKILDAGRLSIISVNDETNDTSSAVSVSDTGRCIMPGSYYAITGSRDKLLARYFRSSDTNVFEVSGLPSMPDDKGHLILLDRAIVKLDEVRYSEGMHFPLLSGTEGISLEKIRPVTSSMDTKNWHSASETCGWATPGTVNSVFTEIPESAQGMIFSSTRITPDNDGNEDVLTIDFRLQGLSNVATIEVFDEYGNLVRRLTQNLFAGKIFSVTWDGTGDDGSVVASGIYIILARIYDETGHTVRWKKACSVVR